MFFYSIFSDQERGSGVVLIPLDQGCFLFALPYTITTTDYCLNPFGSGMFFIQYAVFFLRIFNRLRRCIPKIEGAEKLLHFYHGCCFEATGRSQECVLLFEKGMFGGAANAGQD